jgi:hypothetical protein
MSFKTSPRITLSSSVEIKPDSVVRGALENRGIARFVLAKFVFAFTGEVSEICRVVILSQMDHVSITGVEIAL